MLSWVGSLRAPSNNNINNINHEQLINQSIKYYSTDNMWITNEDIEIVLNNSKYKNKILKNSNLWNNIEILGHTHGQPASLTTMGKEWLVFHDRLDIQMKKLEIHG